MTTEFRKDPHKEPRKMESNASNVVAFPKASAATTTTASTPLKLASKNDRRKIGHDTLHVTNRQANMREDVSSLSIEFMLAIFALITVLVYVTVS